MTDIKKSHFKKPTPLLKCLNLEKLLGWIYQVALQTSPFSLALYMHQESTFVQISEHFLVQKMMLKKEQQFSEVEILEVY